MKKALISIVSVVIILAAIFVTLIIIPQYIGTDYAIESKPVKLEYKLVKAINDAGESYIKLDGDWDTAGLSVVKINKMGQKTVLDSREFSVIFPSRITTAGEYVMFVAINDTDIQLPITITVLAAE